MTEPSPEQISHTIRLHTFTSHEQRQAAIAELKGDPGLAHPHHASIGWHGDDNGLDFDIALTGVLPTHEELHAFSHLLSMLADFFHENSATIDEKRTEQSFEDLAERAEHTDSSSPTAIPDLAQFDLEDDDTLPTPEELENDPSLEAITCPGWAGMGDLDRALAIEHLEVTRHDPNHGLVYLEDPNLVKLGKTLSHDHAMFLVEQVGVPESLDAAERERLASLLADHREANLD